MEVDSDVRGWWADFQSGEISEPGGQDAAEVVRAEVEGGEGGEVGDRRREEAGEKEGGGLRPNAHPAEGKGCDHQPSRVDRILGRNVWEVGHEKSYHCSINI